MLEFKKDTVNREGKQVNVILITNKRNNTNLTIDESSLRKWLESTRTSMKEGK